MKGVILCVTTIGYGILLCVLGIADGDSNQVIAGSLIVILTMNIFSLENPR